MVKEVVIVHEVKFVANCVLEDLDFVRAYRSIVADQHE